MIRQVDIGNFNSAVPVVKGMLFICSKSAYRTPPSSITVSTIVYGLPVLYVEVLYIETISLADIVMTDASSGWGLMTDKNSELISANKTIKLLLH